MTSELLPAAAETYGAPLRATITHYESERADGPLRSVQIAGVREPEGPSDGFNRVRSFVDNPDIYIALQSKGPQALDEEGMPAGRLYTTYSLIPHVRVEPGGEIPAEQLTVHAPFILHENHTFTHDNRARRVLLANSSHLANDQCIDKPPQSAAEGSLMTLYESKPAFDTPKMKQVYQALGTQTNYDGENALGHPNKIGFTAPTPQEFVRRMDEIKTTFPELADHLPDIALLAYSLIPPEPFKQSFADKKFPVSIGSFYYYAHDILSEHLIAAMTYGQPLMELLSEYALEPPMETHKGETVDILNDFTTTLSAVDLTQSDQLGVKYIEPMLRRILSGVKNSGRLGNTSIAKRLVESGAVSDVNDITTEQFATELLQTARQVWDVKQEPKQAPDKRRKFPRIFRRNQF